jgi:hypothetical protein
MCLSGKQTWIKSETNGNKKEIKCHIESTEKRNPVAEKTHSSTFSSQVVSQKHHLQHYWLKDLTKKNNKINLKEKQII